MFLTFLNDRKNKNFLLFNDTKILHEDSLRYLHKLLSFEPRDNLIRYVIRQDYLLNLAYKWMYIRNVNYVDERIDTRGN